MNAESTREALDVASLAGDILLASGAGDPFAPEGRL